MLRYLLLLSTPFVWSACDSGTLSSTPDSHADQVQLLDQTLDLQLSDLGVGDLRAEESGPDHLLADHRLFDEGQDQGGEQGGLRINELMPKNEGAWVDEMGETDDWFELINSGAEPLALEGWSAGDRLDELHPLPKRILAPGEILLLWADKGEGELHLPFKLSASGETLFLINPEGEEVDRLSYLSAQPNDSFQRFPDASAEVQRCPWASPGRLNGARCGPPPPPEMPQEIDYAAYEWSQPWPQPPNPLLISELALRPAGFVELLNQGAEPLALEPYSLRLAPHAPGLPWPTAQEGQLLSIPEGSLLAPGERAVIPLEEEETSALEADPNFEGVLSLWLEGRRYPVDQIDFMHWPERAALSRIPDSSGRHRFCSRLSPGEANQPCEPLARRALGDRVRHLRTPEDLKTLAMGGFARGMESVKFVLDLEAEGVIHLLDSGAWDLHYTFVREQIDGLPHLNRCDPEENRLFRQGWGEFSRENYHEQESRRFLLGTLIHHGGADLHTLEFTPGDQISAQQMRRAFFSVMAHVMEPEGWSLRPQTGRQVEEMRLIEGQSPIVDPQAPFRGLSYQPLTETLGYGVLRFIPIQELDQASLGPQVIVLTDQVPNDISLTGGLITEAFQTPLAHVNLLSRNRDTPNMALVAAREHPRLAPHLGSLIRLEVGGAGFQVSPADPEEAERFWASRRPQGPRIQPRLNLEPRGVIPLQGRGLGDLPALGAKAAQLAELFQIRSDREGCEGALYLPQSPAAIPLVHSLEHFEVSGAAALLEELEGEPRFRADPQVRAEGLAAVREQIRTQAVDPELLTEIEGYVEERYGARRVRFRSSSNTEDLPSFNGAGLYTSLSAQLGDPERRVEDALREVWASLWLLRAYDEREHHHIDQAGVAMGVLIHPAFLSEEVNGVAVSRNVLEPIRSDYYLNLQRGEASVTNPAPGVSTEQLLHRFGRRPRIRYLARSNLIEDVVLSEEEVEHLACTLRVIHDHFQPLIDPEGLNPWFAMDIESKHIGEQRVLVIKQARPYSFGSADLPEDCREL